MSSTTIFRGILIASLIFGLLSVIASVSLGGEGDQQQNEIDNQEISDEEGLFFLAVVLVYLILLIISLIGVWKFKSWARSLLVFLTIGFLPFYIYLGPIVMNPWEAMFYEISIIFEGIVLAMMFTGEVGKKFEPILAKNHN